MTLTKTKMLDRLKRHSEREARNSFIRSVFRNTDLEGVMVITEQTLVRMSSPVALRRDFYKGIKHPRMDFRRWK